MTPDVLMLSRLQFAANVSFHILFPTITIALCWFLLFFRVRFKVFALTFALGVVSGIVMSFQFGTNWPGFMERTGDIAGPLLTLFVALGTTLSAFWILSLNSWMQTPTGYEIVDGRFVPADWLAIVFNPSFPYRFAHKLLASTLTASFLIAGLCAWQLLKGTATNGTHKAMRAAVAAAAVAIPVQFLVGDLHGLNTLEHQPAKVAAMEGIWETERGAPLTLFGIPDQDAGTTHLAIKIPKLASFILTHEWDGELKGIRDYPDAHPPVGPVFYAFRVMVGVGTLMLARVLRVPGDGGGGHAHARRRLLHGMASVEAARRAPHHIAKTSVVGPVGHDLLGVDCHALGLVRDGDRAPALHRVRPHPHRRRRHHGTRAFRGHHAGGLPGGLRSAPRHLRGCAQVHGRAPGAARAGAGHRGGTRQGGGVTCSA